jgi:hypothetical protein
MQSVNQWAQRHGVSLQAYQELLAILHPQETAISASGDTSEADVQAKLRVEAPKNGASLWRNNNGATTDETGRLIRFGLGNDSKRLSEVWKSSDLIGITECVSTAPGQRFGVFTAVEVKEPGWTAPKNKRERAQAAFISTVRSMGGIGLFAQSVADYTRIFGK